MFAKFYFCVIFSFVFRTRQNRKWSKLKESSVGEAKGSIGSRRRHHLGKAPRFRIVKIATHQNFLAPHRRLLSLTSKPTSCFQNGRTSIGFHYFIFIRLFPAPHSHGDPPNPVRSRTRICRFFLRIPPNGTLSMICTGTHRSHVTSIKHAHPSSGSCHTWRCTNWIWIFPWPRV